MGIGVGDVLAVLWFEAGLGIVVVFGRLAVRSWQNAWSFWISEVFLVLALLIHVYIVICETIILKKNLHIPENVDETTAVMLLKWKYFNGLIYDSGLYLAKFSLLAFYNELFPITERKLRFFLHITAIYTLGAFLTTIFLDILWCGPDIDDNWSLDESSCKLQEDKTSMYITWALNISSELFIFMLPFGIFPSLKTMCLREKLGLMALFLMGAITLIVSAARLAISARSLQSLATWIIGTSEIATQILITALPAFRPLFRAASKTRRKLQGFSEIKKGTQSLQMLSDP